MHPLAFIGQPLQVKGSVLLRIERSDGCVSLPEIDVEAVVVETLDVANASVLIGSDVISGSSCT